MRSLLIASALVFGAFGVASGADTPAAAKAENATCLCGKAVDPKITPVPVTVDGKTHLIGVCSKECADVAKADPKKALAGVEAHNKKNPQTK